MGLAEMPMAQMGDNGSLPEDLTRSQRVADEIASRVAPSVFGDTTAINVSYLARGAYNHVWLVESSSQAATPQARPAKFVLRICQDNVTSLQPFQSRNHIGCLQWVAEERTDETEMEEDEWHERYRAAVAEEVRRRDWPQNNIDTFLGEGHEVLNVARMIMFPETHFRRHKATLQSR